MTFPVTRQAALASLALAIAAPAVHADPAELNSVIVTATRTPQAARDVIADTLAIGAEEIANAGAGSITELLQRQRGIEVTRNGGPGTNSGVLLRGANGNQIIVLVDGVRIGSATSGTAAWNAIPMEAVDHIEVVYGPLSTLYGADAIGGVIQIFTKKGKGAPGLSASVGGGSDNTRAYQAAVSGSSGAISYALSAAKERSDGFSATKPGNSSFNADDDGYQRENAAGQFAWTVAPGQELGVLFLHSRTDAQFDSGKNRADSVQSLDNYAVYSRNAITSSWSMLAQAAQSRDKSGSFTSTDSQINTKQTTFNWQNDFRLGEDMLQLLVEHRKEEVEANTSAISRDRDTTSVAASYQLNRGPHLVNIAARNDDSSQYGNKATGSVGYGYRLSSALRLNASFGTSFRAPTFNELYYPGFGVEGNQPERGRNGEVGLNFDNGSTAFSAAYYHNKLTDLLVNTNPCPKPGFTFGCAYNVNKATLEGLTMSARQRLGSFTLTADADFQDPKDDTTGKSLVRRARRHGNVGMQYEAGALHTGVEWQISSYRFDDAANTKRLGGYGLVNLYATWQFSRDWSALVRWNNVADKQYELARFYGTAGSNVFAALRYGFH